ncbi:oxygen-insensitive NADPH nitroreductase [Jeotgalibacillus campisalis]|uniref:FMN reductase n=1 Tax=Jeotgalibacillus campisalis TaxID=220754 RepID=A0A0C2VQT3_9BACL|nr:oxygen-insensitive NADPH nitroreductase [Jeotgalibacillus campisalis]KIL46811.1 FMN reductase [Jeotgalibacillus campisalis]
MNKTIELLENHRSVRKFKDVALTDNQIKTIVEAAQMASTSSFIQAYTIIGITDKEKKKELAALAGGQEYVAESGHLFLFCADLYRHAQIGKIKDADVLPSIESTEKFMVGVIDASLAAQNAAIAAESMGLGICYIGGIRNNLPEVNKLIDAPDYVVPLFGLTVGVPDQETATKPRMPFEMIYHENKYEKDPAQLEDKLNKYDQGISAYYHERTKGARSDQWSEQMAKMLERKSRLYMKDYIEEKKLNRH